jgi:hypothetical protein
MPFPTRQSPPTLRTPGEAYEKPEPEDPEHREALKPPGGLESIGEEFGLDPAGTRQLARKLMQHFMGQCGGEGAGEGEAEEYPE